MTDKPTITEETSLTTIGTFFGDGAKGAFLRLYNIYADGGYTGVVMRIQGQAGKYERDHSYMVEGKRYDSIEEAFKAAGYDWRRIKEGD